MLKKQVLLFTLICFSILAQAQDESYIGAGHSKGIKVTSSDNAQLYPGIYTASADKTINGSGLEGKMMEASRFLAQASFGGSRDEMLALTDQGIEKWLAKQFNTPASTIRDSVQLFYNMGLANFIANGGDSSNYSSRPSLRHFDYAWWNNTMNSKDQLRQRMTYTLSQIMVISGYSGLSGYGIGLSDYYDVLNKNAFGNYKDLLKEVSLHLSMGYYLSHLNNKKTNLTTGQHPDENYAREIMQLFSIGIYKLNIDGSPQLDGSGQPIPTYTNNDIKELAKVFTGLGAGARLDTNDLYFGLGIYIADFTIPMIMYEDRHETGPKTILDGFIIPDGQSGMKDIDDAINHLYNHQNVGPFMAKRLIQHFVKSNPTPGYIQTVAEKFNDNGSGVRGDLKAVLQTILLHPEARSCEWILENKQGKLREPVLRSAQFARYFGGFSPIGDRYWQDGYLFRRGLGQHPLYSTTVFNFYGPNYSPSGPLADQNLVGPEFEINNTNTVVNYADAVHLWVEGEILMLAYGNDFIDASNTVTDLSVLTEVVKDNDALLDHLDLFICHGQLSDRTRMIIKNEFEQYTNSLSDLESKIKLAVYIIMISPDYVILK